MYKKRCEKSRELLEELERIKEAARHTKLKEDSPKLEVYKKVIRAIILEGGEKNEEDIFYEIGSKEVKNYDEKKFSKAFKAWMEKNSPLYRKIFYDICYEEFEKGNLKSSIPLFFTTNIGYNHFL